MAWHRMLLVGCLAGALQTTPLSARGLRVMPVKVEVPNGKRFCSLTVSNEGVEPISIQVRGYGWSIDRGGQETFDPQTGPVINPAIFTLAEGQSQLVRCSLPAAASEAEGSWRLILDELPRQVTPQPGTVRSVLRISIPVFRTPMKGAPALSAIVKSASADAPFVALQNTGNRHIRLASAELNSSAGDRPISPLPASGYILAGSAWILPIKPASDGIITSVTVRLDDGSARTLPVDPSAVTP